MANIISIRIEADGKAAIVETKRTSAEMSQEIGKTTVSVENLKRSLDGLNSPLSSGAAGFGLLGKAATAAVAGFSIQAMVSQLHDAGMAVERLRNSFEAAAGSIHKGAAEQAYARAEAQRLGLDLLSTSDAYLKLTASSKGTALEGENTRAIFSSVAGAGRALGLSSTEMNGALLAISQMMSKGTVQAEELRGQLGERLPGAFNIAARAMGVSTAELNKMLEQGEVISEEFLPKFAAELEKTFPAGEKAMQGMTAETMRLKTAWFELKTTVMDNGGDGLFTNAIRGMKGFVVEADSFYARMSGAYGFLKSFASNPMDPNLVNTPPKQNFPPLNKFEQNLSAPDFSVVGPSGGSSALLGSGDNIFAQPRAISVYKFSKEELKAQKDAEKAAEAAATAALHEENAYTRLYNTLQDRRSQHNPLLSKEQQEMKKLRDEYDTHIGHFPQYRAELERNYNLDKKQLELTQQLNRESKERALYIKDLEEATKDLDVLALAQFGMLNMPDASTDLNAAAAKRYKVTSLSQYRLSQPNAYSIPQSRPQQNDPRYAEGLGNTMALATMDAQGQSDNAAQTRLLMQLDERQKLIEEYHQKELISNEEKNQLLAAADKEYAAQKAAFEKFTMDRNIASIGQNMGQIGEILMQGNKDQFEAGKAFAIASALVNTYMAASAAFSGITASTGGWGIAVAAVAAGTAIATGLAQVAAIESTQYRGGRYAGGPVEPGSTYLVGERGPELLTMGGQGGTVTPNNAMGGQSQQVRVTNVYQISTGVSDTVRAEIMRAVPTITQHSVRAVQQAINGGGELSRAVGRM